MSSSGSSSRHDSPGAPSPFDAVASLASRLVQPRTLHAVSERLWRSLGGERASDEQHAALDLLVSRLRARNILHPHAFYPDGFGEPSALALVAREIRAHQHELLWKHAAARAALCLMQHLQPALSDSMLRQTLNALQNNRSSSPDCVLSHWGLLISSRPPDTVLQ